MPRKKKRTVNEAQRAAARENIKIAREARRQRLLADGEEGTWEYEVRWFGPGFKEWRARTIKERGFDPAGFLEELLTGEYLVNAESLSGEGKIGETIFRPRRLQLRRYRDIIMHRWLATDDERWARWVAENPTDSRPRGRCARLVVKYRRAGFSTGEVQRLNAEGTVNRLCNAVISAHTNDGLDNMAEILRTSVGRSKSVEEEDAEGNVRKVRKAKGMAAKRFETISDSVLRLLGPNDSMGRGWNPMHLLWTETDYVDEIDAALDSVLPSLNKSVFSTVTLESTMRSGASTGFKDFIERSLRGETAYKVYFQGWMDDETAVLTPDDAERAKIEGREALFGSDGYEFTTLIDKFHASIEQVAWWRRRFFEDARSSLASMKEMYPATIDEALEAASGTQFLHEDAMAFQRSNCIAPIERRKASYDSIDEIADPAIWMNQPHLAIFEKPHGMHEYVIGCDGADAGLRQEWEVGSESYFVVLDKQSGYQVAEFHGYVSAQEFAIAWWRASRLYNDALIVPEKAACQGAIDHYINVLQGNRLYERERFGAVIEKLTGVWGFDTKNDTRAILVQRIQDNINRKTIVLRSRYLVDQLDNFSKRKGRPNKMPKRKGTQCDDGPMALGLCMFGHDNAINGAWQPKDAIDLATAPKVRIDTTDRAIAARATYSEDEDEDERFAEARRILNMT